MKSPWSGPALVAAFACLLYVPSIGNGYTLDDFQAILAHPAVTGEAPLLEVFVREYWGRPLAEGWSSSYRPLTSLTFAIEHRLTREAWLHHAVNTLAYATLCAVLVHFARRWCTRPVAIACGLLFAALPVHVESVASIVGRADVLAATLSVAALDLALPSSKAAGVPRPWRGVAAGALYLLALLCKESVALLPALAAWIGWVTLRPRSREAWRALHPVAAMAAVGIGYLVARQQVLSVGLPQDFIPADNLLIERDGLEKLWGKLAVLGHYAELLVIPRRLCADHTYADVIPPTTPWELEALWAWIGVALALGVVWDLRRTLQGRSPGLFVAAVLAYLLIGHFIIDLSVIVAERLALWPSLWLVLGLGAAVTAQLPESQERRRRLLALVLGLVALGGIRSVDRSLDWRDQETIHRSSLEACPRAVHSRFILANVLRERRNAPEAVWHYAVAGAGRHAFPGRFDVPALEAEASLPLQERLRRLPELVRASDGARYWAGLHAFLVSQGAVAEAEVVRRIAQEQAP